MSRRDEDANQGDHTHRMPGMHQYESLDLQGKAQLQERHPRDTGVLEPLGSFEVGELASKIDLIKPDVKEGVLKYHKAHKAELLGHYCAIANAYMDNFAPEPGGTMNVTERSERLASATMLTLCWRGKPSLSMMEHPSVVLQLRSNRRWLGKFSGGGRGKEKSFYQPRWGRRKSSSFVDKANE